MGDTFADYSPLAPWENAGVVAGEEDYILAGGGAGGGNGTNVSLAVSVGKRLGCSIVLP